MSDLKSILGESVPTETVALIEAALAQSISEALDAKELEIASVTAQLQEANKHVDHYVSQLQEAADQVIVYQTQLEEARESIEFQHDQLKEAAHQVIHFEGELQEAVDHVIAMEETIAESSDFTSEELKEQIASYVEEISNLKEKADEFGEYVREATLTEMTEMVEEAKAQILGEHLESFKQLDELARVNGALQSIKESFEKFGFGLSEDDAYNTLGENLQAAQSKNQDLQRQLRDLDRELLESKKELSFSTITTALTETQKEKLKTLSESIVCEEISEYEKVLNILVDRFDSIKTTETKNLTENLNTINSVNKSQSSEQDYIENLAKMMI